MVTPFKLTRYYMATEYLDTEDRKREFPVFVLDQKKVWFWSLRDFPCDLFQMKSTRWTLLLSTFISTSLHVSGNHVPIIRRTYCIYATLVFSFCMGGDNHPYRWPQPPIQNEKYQCRSHPYTVKNTSVA